MVLVVDIQAVGALHVLKIGVKVEVVELPAPPITRLLRSSTNPNRCSRMGLVIMAPSTSKYLVQP